MEINFQNIEDRIFYDKKAQALLPEFRHLFDQWSLAKRVPGLQTMGRRAVLQVLNSLEGEHIQRLEEYFNDIIVVDKLDHHIVRNYQGGLEEAEGSLCQFAGFKDFCLHRDANQVYISFWR